MKTKNPTLNELERLLQLAISQDSHYHKLTGYPPAIQQDIWNILLDIGSVTEQMSVVCELAADDNFSDPASDVLVQLTADKLSVIDELQFDLEAGQLAISLARSENPEITVKTLSNMPFPKAVAILAKLGLYSKSFVRSLRKVLDHINQNPDLIGW